MALFMSSQNGGVAKNVLIERNFFSCPAPGDTIGCGSTINMRPDYQFQNITWRSNEIVGLVNLQGGLGGYSNVTFENNKVGQMSACHASITYLNNTSDPGRQDCDPGSHTPPIGPSASGVAEPGGSSDSGYRSAYASDALVLGRGCYGNGFRHLRC